MSIDQMKNIDIKTVDSADLVDIKNVVIDTKLPLEDRKRDFIKQIKNPYCFKCGDIIVKVSFLDTYVTLEERLQNYFKNL